MFYIQYIASACVGLAITSTSLHSFWPSAAIRKILEGNSSIPRDITNDEISWIITSLLLGTIPGAMISGWMLNKVGRKNSLILLTLPLFLLWFPIAFTTSIWLLCIERFVAGIAISAIIIIVTVYNGEIADKEIRGKLGTTLSGFSLFGEFLVACIGPFVTYQVFAFVNCALPLVATILIYFIPESPYYLTKIGKKEEARLHLTRLTVNTNFKVDVDKEMNNIETLIKLEHTNDSSLWGFLTNPIYRKSLIIMVGMKFLQQLSGSSSFGEYTNKAIKASQINISNEAWKIILTAVPLVGVIISGLAVDKIGRKALLRISLIGCFLTLVTEGVCCMILELLEKDINNISWLSTTSLIAYLIMRSLGLGTLPYVIMGELFATNIKHHAVAFCGTINAITGFLMSKYFGQVCNVNALFITFWIFAAICILGYLFVHFVMIETKCKTFAEIQEELMTDQKCSKTRRG